MVSALGRPRLSLLEPVEVLRGVALFSQLSSLVGLEGRYLASLEALLFLVTDAVLSTKIGDDDGDLMADVAYRITLSLRDSIAWKK